jgi:hypothetical protein
MIDNFAAALDPALVADNALGRAYRQSSLSKVIAASFQLLRFCRFKHDICVIVLILYGSDAES